MGLADWKKKFMDMNTGVSKITIAEELSQNCIQKDVTLAQPTSIDDRLVRILNVKTLGSEVADVLKPKMQTFINMTPMEYQGKLEELINYLQELKKLEKRTVVKPIYQDAIRVLQAETISAGLLEEFRIMLLQG